MRIRSIHVQSLMESNSGSTLSPENARNAPSGIAKSAQMTADAKYARKDSSRPDRDFDASLILSIVRTKTM